MFFRTNYTIINKDFLCSQVINFDYVTKIMLATEGMVHVIPEVMSVYRKGVEGSWTERVMYAKDKAGIIKHFDTKIKNLEEINAYRNYKYDAEIKNKILELKFLNRVYLGDKKVFKDAEFAGFIAQLNRKRRYKLYVQLYFPNLYRWLIFNLRPIIKGNLKCQIPTK